MLEITKPVTTEIENAVKDIPGWSPLDQLMVLFTLAYSSAHLGGDVLEVGSWCGRSAVVMGMAARLTGNTKVHCVDLFPEKNDWFRNPDGNYSFNVVIGGKKYGAYQDQTVWAEPFAESIAPVYEKYTGAIDAFNHAIAENSMNDLVISYKADLELFSQKVSDDLRVRLAFIDGDHSYEAVCKDISIVEKYLLPGGWICFDDAFSSYDGVNRAIQTIIIDSGKYRHYKQMSRKCFVAQRA